VFSASGWACIRLCVASTPMGQTTEAPAAPRKNYLCVQALRAVAAGLVVVHHAITLWLNWITKTPAGTALDQCGGGGGHFLCHQRVRDDVSLPGLAGKRNKAGVFLWRRFTDRAAVLAR